MHQSASTVVCALSARSAVGLQSASTVVGALSARSAVVHQYANTVVSVIIARSAVVHQSASTVVYAIHARSAGSSSHHDSTCQIIKSFSIRVTSRLRSLPPTHYAVSSAAISTLQTVLERSVGCYTRPRSRLSVPP